MDQFVCPFAKLAANGVYALKNQESGDRLRGCLWALKSFSANYPFEYLKFRLHHLRADQLRHFHDNQAVEIPNQ